MNSDWKKSAYKDYLFFNENIKNVRDIQSDILLQIINQNKNTSFGSEYNFKNIKSIEDFRTNVPILDYKDFEYRIKEILQGNKNCLTKEEVLLLEPTAGTSSGSKLIPYTKSLKNEFQRSINTWISDIMKFYPNSINGINYWSISPANKSFSELNSKIPIGFNSDYNYLGWTKEDAAKIFAVPDEISKLQNIDNWYYATALFLLSNKDLSFISIWNPSLILILLKKADENIDNLIYDIEYGKITLPSYEKSSFLDKYLVKNKSRAKAIADIYKSHFSNRFENIWPKLNLISCWADSSSKYYAANLKKLFPNTAMQPKGLLATEGFISIPYYKAKGNLPAYTSHFLEFIDRDNNICLINELEKDKKYTIVLTNGGGLYRYNLHDIIKVNGFYKTLPIIEFIGRDSTLDFVGEKLDEEFILKTINELQNTLKCKFEFFLFAPNLENDIYNYILFTEINSKAKTNDFTDLLDSLLSENFHYNYARKIGQLNKAEVIIINNGINKYFNRCRIEGQSQGDIKAAIIDKRTDWKKHLQS